jgi:predicted enzyme related to lactoylglutathione lyase
MSDESGQTSSSPSLFIFFIGIVFFLLNVWTFRQAYLLKHDAATTQGTVTKTYMTRHKGSVTFNAAYTYEVSGQPYEGTADITRGTFLVLRPGGPIALRYSTSNPAVSEAGDISHSNTTLFLTTYFGFPVSLFILFSSFRKQPRTEEEQIEATSDENIALPNTVKGIAFTMYPVTDMTRARKFYEEDLGLKPEHNVDGKWVEYQMWDNCFALSSMAGEAVKPSADSGGSVAFEVQNVDDFVDQLRKKGIRIKVEPFSTHVCRMAVVIDPEGNALTLHSKKS